MSSILRQIVLVIMTAPLIALAQPDAARKIISDSYFSPDRFTLEILNEAIKTATKLTPREFSELEKFTKNYLKKSDYKVMYGAFPLSCNYRYWYQTRGGMMKAMTEAKRGCQKAADSKNELFGSNCQCRIVALGNTLLYENDTYQGMHNLIPMIGQVITSDYPPVAISGIIEVYDAGSTTSTFKISGKNGNTLCKGSYNTLDTARGKADISCFDGEIIGKGEFVNTGFNRELRIPLGTALFDLGNKGSFEIIFGPDALK